MQSTEMTKALSTRPELAGLIYVPHSAEECQRPVTLLDSLVDEVAENESHPLASLMEIVGVLLERYEDEHVPELID